MYRRDCPFTVSVCSPVLAVDLVVFTEAYLCLEPQVCMDTIHMHPFGCRSGLSLVATLYTGRQLYANRYSRAKG